MLLAEVEIDEGELGLDPVNFILLDFYVIFLPELAVIEDLGKPDLVPRADVEHAVQVADAVELVVRVRQEVRGIDLYHRTTVRYVNYVEIASLLLKH